MQKLSISSPDWMHHSLLPLTCLYNRTVTSVLFAALFTSFAFDEVPSGLTPSSSGQIYFLSLCDSNSVNCIPTDITHRRRLFGLVSIDAHSSPLQTTQNGSEAHQQGTHRSGPVCCRPFVLVSPPRSGHKRPAFPRSMHGGVGWVGLVVCERRGLCAVWPQPTPRH